MAVDKTPFVRGKRLFDPESKTPFRLSRSRLENFIKCARCFYLDRRLGIEPPGMPAFTLNSAVDTLLKREFDGYRRQRKPHPIMESFSIAAIPFAHPLLEEWRENFKGVQFHHRPSNMVIFGAVDDLWINSAGEILVVDYKATSTDAAISLESEYRQAYKRQMEIYQWLLRKQPLKVSNTGYFLFCNGDKNKAVFDGKLEFSMEIIAYEGSDAWVERAILAAYECLKQDCLPDYTPHCPYCEYITSMRGKEEEKRQAIPVQPELF